MRTEKGGERIFYHALAALLFAALCAWSGAALYFRLDGDAPPVSTPEATPAPAGGGFRGLLLRREERLPVGAFPGTGEGARLSASETGSESALYFLGCDGLEALSPDGLDALTPERLEALLDAKVPERDAEAGRLVYDFTLLLAALFDGDAAPAPGTVRLRLEGVEEELRAELLSVTEDPLGRRMLILKLTKFPEALYKLRFVEGEIVG